MCACVHVCACACACVCVCACACVCCALQGSEPGLPLRGAGLLGRRPRGAGHLPRAHADLQGALQRGHQDHRPVRLQGEPTPVIRTVILLGETVILMAREGLKSKVELDRSLLVHFREEKDACDCMPIRRLIEQRG